MSDSRGDQGAIDRLTDEVPDVSVDHLVSKHGIPASLASRLGKAGRVFIHVGAHDVEAGPA